MNIFNFFDVEVKNNIKQDVKAEFCKKIATI